MKRSIITFNKEWWTFTEMYTFLTNYFKFEGGKRNGRLYNQFG